MTVPSNRPAGGRLAILAGGGPLPAQIAAAALDSGEKPFVVLIDGEAEADPVYERCERAAFRIEDFALLRARLNEEGVKRLVMAGTVGRRPRLSAMRLSADILKLLPRALRAMASGDDVLLRLVVSYFEDRGIRVVGAQEIVPDLLTASGDLAKARPTKADRADIEAGIAAARALGALDIGQAAIAIGGRVVALEDIDGTQSLLRRVAALRGHGRLAGKKRGVLVKCAKPQQELRADLPAIGPETVRDAAAAGLAGIALDAGHTFILDQARTLAAADEAGLFILGVEVPR